MERIQLVDKGQSYSRIIAGCMRWGLWGAKCDKKGYEALLQASLDQGITTFDHADIYGDYTTEAEFGEAFKELALTRDKIEIITKFGIKMLSSNRPMHKIKSYDTSSQHIVASVEQSLKNLNTDYIDLLLLHRPSPLMHAEEIAEAFTQLKMDGKVLEFGVSNFSTTEFDLIHNNFELATNQLELSVLVTNAFMNGTLTELQAKGIKPQAWSPVGGSLLFSPAAGKEMVERSKRFQKLCESNGWSLSEMALLFILHHPSSISPVIGTSNIDRIEKAALTSQKSITDEQWFGILKASTGRDVT